MLEEKGIDVNCVDDKGWTLLCLAMNSLTNENQEDYITFLLDKHKADVNKSDLQKNTPLHYWSLAEYEFNDKLLRTDLKIVLDNQQNEIAKHWWIGELLIKHGADLTLKNS